MQRITRDVERCVHDNGRVLLEEGLQLQSDGGCGAGADAVHFHVDVPDLHLCVCGICMYCIACMCVCMSDAIRMSLICVAHVYKYVYMRANSVLGDFAIRFVASNAHMYPRDTRTPLYYHTSRR